ncbi:MAG: leucyl aminopeptidase, partial [Pseudomonadota bacterium]
ADRRTSCALVPVYEGRRLDQAGKSGDAAWDGIISRVMKRGDIRGKAGESLVLHAGPDCNADRIVLIGCGSIKGTSTSSFRKIAKAAATALKSTNSVDAVVHLINVNVTDADDVWKARILGAAFLDSAYVYSGAPGGGRKHPSRKISLATENRTQTRAVQGALDRAKAIGTGTALARELGNLPGNVCTPTYLASAARKLAGRYDSVSIKVLNETEMKRLGMNTLLAVAAGSAEPPRLIVAEYHGGADNERPIVLVGKGVTFDSGGISLKPGASMDEMKFDMCGAASVLGTLNAVAEMALPVNLVCIVAATENLPSSTATKPGDVIKSMSGKTVEILNTDAEGRLILCDALTYAERFDPDVVVDVATLTGACMVALGQIPSGLFSNHDGLAGALLEAGQYTGDRAWQMPIWDDFQDLLKSNFADMANIGGRFGGAITAACFLARFAENQRWAHLDIAGTAWHSGANKGATGRPVPLLTQFVMNHKPRRKSQRSGR